MTHPLLHRRPHQDRPRLTVLPDVALTLARLHEACGPARRTFALLAAARTSGPVFWISPAWEPDRPNPDGMMPLADPSRFIFVTPRRPEQVLWTMEEALRAGCVPLVIADIPAPPSLTAVRRLHFAAETGMAEAGGMPLGLLLTPGDGGAPGVESRWHMAPAHAPGRTAWTLTRTRARTEPVRSWRVRPDGKAFTAEPAALAREPVSQDA